MYDGEVVWEDKNGSHFRQFSDKDPFAVWAYLTGMVALEDELLILVTVKRRTGT